MFKCQIFLQVNSNDSMLAWGRGGICRVREPGLGGVVQDDSLAFSSTPLNRRHPLVSVDFVIAIHFFVLVVDLIIVPDVEFSAGKAVFP